MADAFYEEYRDAMLGAWTHSYPDLDTDNIRAGLRDEGTTALDLATQVDLADVVAAHVDATGNLTATVGSAGVGAFDHANEDILTVAGATVESIDYYKYSGADATSPLLANIDGWTGLPLTPNGGTVTLAPAAGGVWQIT